MRDYALAALGDPDGVLVVDETGFVKKGEHSVGAARQYTGTAGRIENAQVGVFLAYASRFRQTLIDRRLPLPESWANDEKRRAGAYVPEAIGFATKVEKLAISSPRRSMGRPCDGFWRTRSMASIPACVRCWRRAASPMRWRSAEPGLCALGRTAGVRRRHGGQPGRRSFRRSFVRLSAGQGSKGLKLSNWARAALAWPTEEGFERWLLIRRSLAEGDKQAYYLVLRAQRDDACRARRRRRPALDDRGMFRAQRAISASIIAKPAPGVAGIAI